MSSPVINLPAEILLAPEPLLPIEHPSQPVIPLPSIYKEVASNNSALCTLVLPPKTMGITVSYQHLHQLSHFNTEAYAYPLFNMEQLIDLTGIP